MHSKLIILVMIWFYPFVLGNGWDYTLTRAFNRSEHKTSSGSWKSVHKGIMRPKEKHYCFPYGSRIKYSSKIAPTKNRYKNMNPKNLMKLGDPCSHSYEKKEVNYQIDYSIKNNNRNSGTNTTLQQAIADSGYTSHLLCFNQYYHSI